MRQSDYKREQICQFRLRADLSGPAKAIALHLYDRDGPGGAFPTLKELGAVTGHKERMTRYHVAELRDAGVITVQINAGGNGKIRADRRPNLYTVDLLATRHGVQPIAPRNDTDGVQPIAPRKPHGGQPIAAYGGQPIAAKRQKENVRKDDDTRVRVHASDPAPSSSSFVPVHSTCQKAARQVAASRGKTNGYWKGVLDNWRTERDDRGLTRFDKCRLWLESGTDTDTVIDRLIRDAPLTEPVVIIGPRSIDHPPTCACHGEGVVKVDDRGQGTYARCRGIAI